MGKSRQPELTFSAGGNAQRGNTASANAERALLRRGLFHGGLFPTREGASVAERDRPRARLADVGRGGRAVPHRYGPPSSRGVAASNTDGLSSDCARQA